MKNKLRLIKEQLFLNWEREELLDRNAQLAPYLELHWSQFADGVEFVRQSQNAAKLKQKRLILSQQFKETDLWVKDSEKQVRHISMNDVYLKVLSSLRTKTREEELEIEVSFLGPQGPFAVLNYYDLLNKDLFMNFIQSDLLSNKINTRHWRFQTCGQILVQYGENFHQSFRAQVLQVSQRGILLGVNDQFIQEKKILDLKVYMNESALLKLLEGKSIDYTRLGPFFSLDSNESFQVNTEDFSFMLPRFIDDKKLFTHFLFLKQTPLRLSQALDELAAA